MARLGRQYADAAEGGNKTGGSTLLADLRRTFKKVSKHLNRVRPSLALTAELITISAFVSTIVRRKGEYTWVLWLLFAVGASSLAWKLCGELRSVFIGDPSQSEGCRLLRWRIPASLAGLTISLIGMSAIHWNWNLAWQLAIIGFVCSLAIWAVSLIRLAEYGSRPRSRLKKQCTFGAVIGTAFLLVLGSYVWATVQVHNHSASSNKHGNTVIRPIRPATRGDGGPGGGGTGHLPASTTTAASPTTTTTTQPCLVAPGDGVPNTTIQELMINASHAASAPQFSCATQATKNPDGSYIQLFTSTSDPAVLIGSLSGAGVADGPNLQALNSIGDGVLSVASLGGQLLDRFNCFNNIGDIQVIVNSSGEIITMLIRSTKTQDRLPATPIVVGGAIIASYAAYFLSTGQVLAPTGTASSEVGGGSIQTFVNPIIPESPPIEFAGSGLESVPTFTASALYQSCTDMSAPIWMLVPPPSNL